jgi:Arylsulfotransferase (ASST)
MNVIPSHRVLVTALVMLAIVSACAGQAAHGFRLFGPLTGTDTHLFDPAGNIVHTWPSTYLPGVGVYLLDDGSLLRTIRTPNGPSIGGVGGGVQRVALDGTVLWHFRYDGPAHWSHHDVEPMPNGNVLMIAWQNKTVAQAIAAGRDPALITGTVMRPDSVIEVQPTGPTTGTIVWEWHVWDHLVQDFDPTKANYGVVAAHPELVNINHPAQAADWNHMNSVKYDAVYDRILLSSHGQSEFWVIDHSTTTAEAAGHTGGLWGKGGDLLYRYGNPQVYGAGTAADRVFFGQHSARVIPPGYPGAGNFTVFNNDPPGGGSSVWEFTPPLDGSGNFVLTPGTAFGPAAPVWVYTASGFDSTVVSSAERLPNGNTLICSGFQSGWVFEVTPGGQVVSSITLGLNAFHAHYVERTLWSDKASLSGAAGGSVTFDLILGPAYAAKTYVVLGSASGTSPGIVANGHVLPLNLDAVLLFSLEQANTPLLTNTLGTLSPLGRATASFNLPPGMIGGPVSAHFAAGVLEPATTIVLATTNPVPLTVGP